MKKLTNMNLEPTVRELSDSVLALQDYLNETFKELKQENCTTLPEEFTEILRNHFCDFLDSAQTVESVLESVVEAMSEKYKEEYNKTHGLAKVYYLSEYRGNKPQENNTKMEENSIKSFLTLLPNKNTEKNTT